MPSVQHPQTEERAKRRNKLRRRTKPDYCYSDKQNSAAEVPEYNGPFEEQTVFPDFWAGYTPEDDGKLNPMDAEEELIELYQKRLQSLVILK